MKQLKIIILIFVLTTFISFGSENKTDNMDFLSKVPVTDYIEYSTSNKEAIKELEKGNKFLEQGDLKMAFRHFNKAHELDDDFCEAYNMMGIVYLKAEKYETAEKVLDDGLDCNSKDLRLLQNLVIAYMAQNRILPALEKCKSMIEIAPEDPEPYYMMAIISADYIKNYDLAILNSQKAIERYKKANSPMIVDGYRQMGFFMFMKNNYGGARDYYIKAKELGAEIREPMNTILFDKGRIDSVHKIINKQIVKHNSTKISEMDDEEREEFLNAIANTILKSPMINLSIINNGIEFSNNKEYLIAFSIGVSKYQLMSGLYDDKEKSFIKGIEYLLEFYDKNITELNRIPEIERLKKLHKKDKLIEYYREISDES